MMNNRAGRAFNYLSGAATQPARRFFLYIALMVMVALFFTLPWSGARSSSVFQQQGKSTSFSPSTVVLASVANSTTITVVGANVDAVVDGTQISVKHPAQFTVTSTYYH